MIVEADGVTLALDPARADLLVEAELSRFTDPLPTTEPVPGSPSAPALRRFVISPASLRRGLSRGVSAANLADWFARRTSGEIPPALQLLLMVKASRVPTLKPARMIVLNLPSAILLDGLLQHPTTGHLLGDRLGPTSVAIPDEKMVSLHKALSELGINFEESGQ